MLICFLPMAADNPVICHMQSSSRSGNLDVQSHQLVHIHSSHAHHEALGSDWAVSAERRQLIIHISCSTSIIMWNLSGSQGLQNLSFPFREPFSPFENLGGSSGARESSMLSRTWVVLLSHQVPFLTSNAQNIPLGGELILNHVSIQIKWTEPNRQAACSLPTPSCSM